MKNNCILDKPLSMNFVQTTDIIDNTNVYDSTFGLD